MKSSCGSRSEKSRRYRNKLPTMALRSGAVPFPGYILDRPLGKGGWGEVWKAIRTEDGNEVALKFLPVSGSSATPQEIRALQAIRQLRHPHLVQIEQVWCTTGYVVVAMELAEGNLLDLLNTSVEEYHLPILADHVCYFLSQAAEAIDFLNARQHQVNDTRMAFRHCDVKPSNILIFGDKVKLADFSLSVATMASFTETRHMGTPQYAAPEIYKGRVHENTDQFSLAVTYCLLRGGRFPFLGTPSFIDPKWKHPEADLTMLNVAERPIIRRALSIAPQDRWGSCKEMIRKLQRCQPAAPLRVR